MFQFLLYDSVLHVILNWFSFILFLYQKIFHCYYLIIINLVWIYLHILSFPPSLFLKSHSFFWFYYFFSLWRISFSSFFSEGMQMLNFCLLKGLSLWFPILTGNLAGYKILSWQMSSFSIVKTFSGFLLAAVEK